MKTIYKTFAPFSILLIFTACLEGPKKQKVEVNTPEEVKNEKAVTQDQFDEKFIDGMTETVWNYYSEVRMALINSDESQAGTAAKYLADGFGDKHPDLKALAEQMNEADDIEEQRRLFHELSLGLEPIFTKALSEGTIYKQYCPMAFDNKGAYWLSNIAEVQNPYFGDKMLRCGEVKKIIHHNEAL